MNKIGFSFNKDESLKQPLENLGKIEEKNKIVANVSKENNNKFILDESENHIVSDIKLINPFRKFLTF